MAANLGGFGIKSKGGMIKELFYDPDGCSLHGFITFF